MDLRADEIEREIHRRFSEQVYVGMGWPDYHSALAHVIVRVVAEHLAERSGHGQQPP